MVKLDDDLKDDLKDFGLGVLVTGLSALVPLPTTPITIGAGAYTLLQGRKLYGKLKKKKLFKAIVGRDESPIDRYFRPKERDKD